jgi:hypothetical protein
MQRIATILLAIAATFFSSACSLMAPQYSASIDNVQTLKEAGSYTTKIGQFASEPDDGAGNLISIRGSSMASPYQNSYSAYLAEAIKQELSLAQKLSTDASTEITGTVLKNDVDVSGFDVGNVEIQARFVVKRNGAIRYNEVKSIRTEFPSSFMGSVAIPRGISEYPVAVQKLLGSLYLDKAFIEALK